MNKTIAIIGFVQALFGIALFIAKRPRHISFYFLITWLAVIAVFLGARLLPFEVVEYFKPGIFPFLFLFGPLLYMYLSSLTIENFRIKPVYNLHLLPFLLVCIHRSIVDAVPITSSPNPVENPSYLFNKIYYSVFILSLLTYWIFSLVLIYNHKKNIPFNFSNYTSRNTLNWSIFVLTLFLILFIADFSMFYLSRFLNFRMPSIPVLSLNITLFTFIIIFFGTNQTAIYHDKSALKEIEPSDKEPFDSLRGDRGLLEEKQREELTELILQYLEARKPYLNPEYSLQMMVDDLNISRQKLSYLINSGQQKNFYKFINEFRIREVKEKLTSPGYSHYSVLGIGLDCGFNSKTSFNRIFKEETGFTPSEYRKRFSA
ncbi:MAG: helix-turn-helix domain-containing protein [Bacteroidales bacterium]